MCKREAALILSFPPRIKSWVDRLATDQSGANSRQRTTVDFKGSSAGLQSDWSEPK